MDKLIKSFDKIFGVNTLSSPLGSCTEIFLLIKAIETVEKSELNITDKECLTKLFNENMYHNIGKFSNGKHAGEWYINIIKEYFNKQFDKREQEILNIVVINCDDKQVEYEWNSIKDFVLDMNSDNENIPMLDDALVEVNTNNKNLNLWWEIADYNTVNDLCEECKQIEIMSKYNATFTSVWDGGLKINARCYVSKSSILRVGNNDVCNGIEESLDILEDEYK